MTDAPGKMIYIWGDPIVVISNFDPQEDMAAYARGSVVVTWHFDGDMTNAGSLSHENALYIDEDQVGDLISALKEFGK